MSGSDCTDSCESVSSMSSTIPETRRAVQQGAATQPLPMCWLAAPMLMVVAMPLCAPVQRGFANVQATAANAVAAGVMHRDENNTEPRRRRRQRGELRLAECLEQLNGEDARRILRLKFGQKATPASVQSYFESRYGDVESLLLANSLECRNIMAFLVMRDADDVVRVLADGSTHEVAPGISVQARAFEAFAR